MARATKKVFFEYLLGLADDHVILAQNLITLVGKAPILEEELASCNTALDLLGQARAIYGYAAEIEDKGRSEDDLVYFRPQNEFLNVQLVEQPNIDFAHTILRQYLFSSFYHLFWTALTDCKDETLQAIGQRAEKESAYQLQHSADWIERLGNGTKESHQRLVQAIDCLSGFTDELFANDACRAALPVTWRLPDCGQLQAPWKEAVAATLGRAGLSLIDKKALHCAGRKGRHTEHLGHLLTDLQFMQRSYPGLEW